MSRSSMSTTATGDQVFHLPDVGEGLTEAEIVTWHIAVGDTVTVNTPVVEIETAKSLVELPSPFAGTVTALLAEAGSTIPVGAPLFAVGAASPSSSPAPAQPDSAPEEESARPSVLVGYGPSTESTRRRRKREESPETTSPTGVSVSTPPAAAMLAKPPVRKLAKDNGIDLREVEATGPHGTVTRADVLRRLPGESGADPVTVAAPPTGDVREERIPIRGVRKHTAAAMVRSAFTAPHVTEFATVDMTATMALLTRLKSVPALAGVKLTPLTLVARALLVALRDNPTLNSSWDEQAGEIVLKKYVNLGIAAATPRGLVVPNVVDADRMNLRELATAIENLTLTAREGKSSPAELSGGTVTITNIGVFGVDTATPILNPGEAAILCLGAIRKQPWVVDDAVAIRSITTLGLSFDHRLVDGQQGSRFLADLARILEEPLHLIALA